ncbi:MAG: transketolase [Christensenellaceae bacterium]|jgi:transketolase|nr:transketolase [Christensenellaceae bacterium]
MTLSKQEWIDLEKKAAELRELCIETVNWAGSGHWGGSSSCADILTLLYYKYANFDPKNPTDPDRDRIVVSKGHVGIVLAPMFALLGLVKKEDLKTFNHTGSKLGIHLDSNKVVGLDSSTGSLGHGSSLGLGMALAGQILGKNYKTFVVLGDGECDEGSVWEAAMATAHFTKKKRGAGNLITIVDRNHNMIDGNTEDIMALEPFEDKWKAFGFETIVVNGHDIPALSDALEKAIAGGEKPYCIIADTVKGQGVSFSAGNYKWHYGALDEAKYNTAKADLAEYAKIRIARAEKEGK